VPAQSQPQPAAVEAAIEQYLEDYLGVRHILWLGDGIEETTPTVTWTT
jgi:agmatine/peptidylarginine deiminase